MIRVGVILGAGFLFGAFCLWSAMTGSAIQDAAVGVWAIGAALVLMGGCAFTGFVAGRHLE